MDLDEIKKRKIEELQKQLNQDMSDQVELQQQINQVEMIVKQKMTKKALSRFGNIKAAHPEKYIQLLAILGQSIHKINLIDDDILKDLLAKLEPKRKKFEIRRK